MSSQEVLNQDEIDALLNGVDAGAVSTDPPPEPGETRAYDFSREMRIVRGRMPTLEMVNERFARQLRVTLYNLVRRTVEMSVGQVSMKKFSEFRHASRTSAGVSGSKSSSSMSGARRRVTHPSPQAALVDSIVHLAEVASL